MRNSTLVLNADYSPLSIVPISTVSWQNAITMLVTQKATALEMYEDWTIHSARAAFQVPAIIVTKKYFRRLDRIKYSSSSVFLRDEFKCAYCKQQFPVKELTIDHVVPKSKGGLRTWENSVTACRSCNAEKADKMIRPDKIPIKPSVFSIVNKRKKFPIVICHESWKSFLDWPENLYILCDPRSRLRGETKKLRLLSEKFSFEKIIGDDAHEQ
jgi:5-methylcytosine-specific restriction endonuclease McrA